MSFVWKRPEGRLKSPEQVARELVEVARARGLDEFAAVLATMCVAQESDFWCPWNRKDDSSQKYPFDSESNDGRSVGYFQQQNGRAGEELPAGDRDNWWGSMASRMDLKRSAGEFYDRLEDNYRDAINDPGMASRRFIQNVQRSGYPEAYAKHWDRAWQLVRAAQGAPAAAPAPTAPQTYGMPRGSNSGGYGGNGVKFPDWVYALGNAFGIKPSTYPGHQENNRNEAGYAPNPQNLNRGIDWAAPGAPDQWDRLTRFADYLATIPQHLEQVIWQNPHTMRSIEVAGGRHQPGYFRADLAGHRDHVHTRQSKPIPLPGGAPPPPPRPVGGAHRNGNATWLADALRAEGLKVVEYPGWRERSNGNSFGEISGVILHHTGSNNASAASIANGRPDLRGPLSQIHLGRDGTVTVVAAGCANHAGTGALPWLPKGTGNRRTIGIEAANDGGGSPGKPHRSSWPAVQYDAYVRTVTVILRETGWGADRAASHQEYDKGDPATFEGKWDPGAIDMNIFRGDVAARLNSAPIDSGDIFMALNDAEQHEMLEYLRWMARPGTGEFRKLFFSRSQLRDPGEGAVDTAVGMDLNTDGNVDLLATYLRAQLRVPSAIARLKRVAASQEPGRNSEDAQVAQAMLAELAKQQTPTVVNNVAGAAPTVQQIDADAVARAVIAAMPAPAPATQNRELADAYARIASLEAELAAVRATPATAVAVVEQPETSGARVGRVVDAVEGFTDLALTMDAGQRAALNASIRVLELPNGSETS